jgi:RNA polymerase sigma factor (sigma-70 family)
MTPADSAFRRFRTDGSHDAFREVVAAHLPMVYGTALRFGHGNGAEAEDVSQMVFADLARKAASLREGAAVGAWLHRHTCFLMKNAIRSDIRRRAREAEAVELNASSGISETDETWECIEGRLDRCLESMRETDRRVLVLRFFEGRAMREVGDALGISDDAAQKRVTRALDRLRALVAGRRTSLSSASLATAMAARVRAEVPLRIAAPLARSSLQLAGARSGALSASSGSAAVAAAWVGVFVMAGIGIWRAWPHWQHQAIGATAFSPHQQAPTEANASPGRSSPALTAAAVHSSGQNVSGKHDVRTSGSNATAATAKSANRTKTKSREELEIEAKSKASTMHKWMIAYALDHGGHFPPDLSALFSPGSSYGLPVAQAGEWLGPVIEYRGRKLTFRDDGRHVMMKYRIEGDAEREVRVLVSGEVLTCPVNEPEDAGLVRSPQPPVPSPPQKP